MFHKMLLAVFNIQNKRNSIQIAGKLIMFFRNCKPIESNNISISNINVGVQISQIGFFSFRHRNKAV